MADRNVKYIFGRKKVETMLPVTRRPECNEDVMAALLEAPAQIDYVALGAAVVSRR